MSYETLASAKLTRGEQMALHKRLARMVAEQYPNVDERAAQLGETENLVGLLFQRMNVVRVRLRNGRVIAIVPKEEAPSDDLI